MVDGRPPSQLEFSVTPGGKPILVGAAGRPSPLAFSLTHTRGLVACAIGLAAVGIDAEDATRDADVDGVAERFFAAAERDALMRLPEDARRSRFFELWTLKESLLKALGLGLSHPLEDLAFTISAAGAIHLESGTVDAAAWTFVLDRIGDYCLGMAVAHTAGSPSPAVRLTEAQCPLPRSVGSGGT